MSKKKSDSPTFGESLATRRTASGLSQNKLATLIGVTPGYVSMIERGTRNPPMRTIVKLAKGLGTTASKLMEGIE